MQLFCLNTGQEGIRAAFYVNWDAGSYSSLKEYFHQIDILYPEAVLFEGEMGVEAFNEEFRLTDDLMALVNGEVHTDAVEKMTDVHELQIAQPDPVAVGQQVLPGADGEREFGVGGELAR